MTHEIFGCMQFSSQIFGDFPHIFLLLISHSIIMRKHTSYDLCCTFKNTSQGLFYGKNTVYLGEFFHGHLRSVYPAFGVWGLQIPIGSTVRQIFSTFTDLLNIYYVNY